MIYYDKFNKIIFNIKPTEKVFEISSKNSDVGENKTKVEGVLKGDDIEIRPRKDYLGFIRKTNFVDVQFQSRNLKIFINLKMGELDDPKNICRDVSNVGHWGNGDYQLKVEEDSDLDYIMFLVKQSYLVKV